MRQKKFLTIIPFVLLLVSTLYSYSSADWEVDEIGRWVLMGKVNMITLGLNMLALCVTLWQAAHSQMRPRLRRLFSVVTPLFLFAVVFWTILSVASSGFRSVIETYGSPIAYMAILGIYVGADEESWRIVKKIAPIFAVIYLVMAYFPYQEMKSMMELQNVAGNNPITVFMITAFWWVALSVIEIGNKSVYYKLFMLLLIAVCAFLAFSLTLRSWVIQSLLLLIVTMWQISRSKLVRVVVVAVVAVFLVNSVDRLWRSNQVADEVESFDEKMMEDTRSNQYREFFDQVSLLQLFTGQGMEAGYMSTEGGLNYKYIDNQYLYSLFHYGALLTLPWLCFWLIALFKRKEGTVKIAGERSSMFIVFMWLMALGGLSVYNAVTINPQNFVIALIAGRSLFHKINRNSYAA